MTIDAAPRPMTIGQLAQRTGTTIKALRSYTDWGLIYTTGRSPAGYRLYDDDALWCVRVIDELRGLGLTLAEIRELLQACPQSLGPALAPRLDAARQRIDARIADLERTRARLDAFQTTHRAALAGHTETWLRDDHPRHSMCDRRA